MCDGVGWYIGWDERDGTIIEKSITCTCAAGRAIIARRNARLLAMSSLPGNYQTWTFESYAVFDLAETQRAVSRLMQIFAGTGQVLDRRGVYLYGDVGLGKSGLAAATVHRAIRAGNTALYITVPDLLNHLRSTYAPDATVGYDELLDRIQNAQLLVLDDLGTERASSWAVEKLYQIIDHRCRTGGRLIVTSNLAPNDLLLHLEGAASWTGKRIVDRLMAMCTPVLLTGRNLRESGLWRTR